MPTFENQKQEPLMMKTWRADSYNPTSVWAGWGHCKLPQ